MTDFFRHFCALLNAPVALGNLLAAVSPEKPFWASILHAIAFAFSASVGLWIWNDK